jgi:hypothetical protein
VTRVAQPPTQNVAAAGDGWPPVAGRRLGLLGRVDEGQLDSAEQPSRGVNPGEGDVDPLLHGGIRDPFCHARAVRVVRPRLPECREMVRAGGMLDGRAARGALTCQREAAAAAVPSRPHRRRIDGGLGEQAATAQDGKLVRSARVVVGFAPMQGLHVQGMAEDTREPMVSAEVRAPVPGQPALYRHNDRLTRGRTSLENRRWASWPVAVQPARPGLMQDADRQGPGLQVEATVKLVLRRVKAHEVSSSGGW